MIEIGKRVEKIDTGPDDIHQNGDEGVLVGGFGEYGIVEWDQYPGTHNLVYLKKLMEIPDETPKGVAPKPTVPTAQPEAAVAAPWPAGPTVSQKVHQRLEGGSGRGSGAIASARHPRRNETHRRVRPTGPRGSRHYRSREDRRRDATPDWGRRVSSMTATRLPGRDAKPGSSPPREFRGQRRPAEGAQGCREMRMTEEQRKRLEAASGIGKSVRFVEKGETERTKMGTVLDEVYIIVGDYKHLIQRSEEPYWDGSRIGYRTRFYTFDAKGKNIKFGQYTQFLIREGVHGPAVEGQEVS